MFDDHGPSLDIKWEKPDLAYTGPKTYQQIMWQTFEHLAWKGRNWRRIKRERRKFIAQAD